MFDLYSSALFNELPRLPGMNTDECRRILTKAYLLVISHRTSSEKVDSLERFDFKFGEEELDFPEEYSFHETIVDIISELRRLGDTLESFAVFDEGIQTSIRKASSFVAAESFSLLATLAGELEGDLIKPLLLSNESTYTRIEAALLYMVAGYDANALTEITKVSKLNSEIGVDGQDTVTLTANWALQKIIALCQGKVWPIEHPVCPYDLSEVQSRKLSSIIKGNQYHLYRNIGVAVVHYLNWLADESKTGKTESVEILQKIASTSSKQHNALYPEIYHLARLLLAVIDQTSVRSLVHSVPPPTEHAESFGNYLRSRTRGEYGASPRPFLWPSTEEYVSKCLPGPHKHAVVSMPTGSGKSFVAELAIAQALTTGWVLYLAPTNALTHQIRRDLSNGLSAIGVEVRSFVGHDEYSTLKEEVPDMNSSNFVAVMTPEKCALALRLTPEIFQMCSLCVFDECHLIGEKGRGAIADLVISQLITINHDVKFVLMSAMMSNPQDLADWLEGATGTTAEVPKVTWRPTRTIRGAVGIDFEEAKIALTKTKEELSTMKPHRKGHKTEVTTKVLFGLSGVWQVNDESDYGFLSFDTSVQLKVTREQERGKWTYSWEAPSWVNHTSSVLGKHFALHGIPTIVFIPSNRHYPFGLAKEVKFTATFTPLSERIDNLILIAEAELGLQSEVGRLLKENKVAVHSAAMLESEKEVAEEAFKRGNAPLIFATGTLAQGLNLPSVAVIIAGTRVGDAREANTPDAKRRAKALILNAIGRAGRAGFANQSLSLIVPDNPILFKEATDPRLALSRIDVLKEADASISLSSPLESFLDRIVRGAINPEFASETELTLVALLTDENDGTEKATKILRKTYAAHSMLSLLDETDFDSVGKFIATIKREFAEKANVPEWIVEVARKAGVDFFTTLKFYEILHIIGIPEFEVLKRWSLREWNEFLFHCLSKMPPKRILSLVPENETSKNTVINRLKQAITGYEHHDIVQWGSSKDWGDIWKEFSELTWSYMNGATLKQLSAMFLNIAETEVESARSAGKPIPTILFFINDTLLEISRFAGVLVALMEEQTFKDIGVPLDLGALPLAIKHGCNDYSSLCWYRFGIRYRKVAHLLASCFPLSNDCRDDSKAKEEILKHRWKWLREEISLGLSETDFLLLNAAKYVILHKE